MTVKTDVNGYPKLCDRCGKVVLSKHSATFLTVVGPKGKTLSKHTTHLRKEDCDGLR